MTKIKTYKTSALLAGLAVAFIASPALADIEVADVKHDTGGFSYESFANQGHPGFGDPINSGDPATHAAGIEPAAGGDLDTREDAKVFIGEDIPPEERPEYMDVNEDDLDMMLHNTGQ